MSDASAPRVFARLGLFLLAVTTLAIVVERAARPLWPEAGDQDLKQRIDVGFAAVRAKPYECMVLGNSRVYRGINPDRLGLRAYNFAQDDDAFNQVFYKLMYLETNGVRVNTAVIGVDYFQFSFLSNRRNFAYAPHFPPAYLDDFSKPPEGRLAALLHPIDEVAFNTFMVRYFTRPASLLLERALARLRGERPAPPVRAYVKDNGQYVIEAPAGVAAPVERDATRLPIQERYFEASLDWARRNGVRVFLVMPPLRRLEREAYSRGAVEAFDRWLDDRARAYGATYLNFSTDPRFSEQDFADITHLTPEAADRFSSLLGEAMRRAS
jgi:hypothetical protein